MKEKLPSDPVRNGLLLKAFFALAVTFVAMKIHAEVAITFASTQFANNVQSDGSALDDSFTFELGTFSDGFVPDATNTDQWLANWTSVQDSLGNPIPEATASYGEIETFFGTTEGFSSIVNLDHNTSPFDVGDQGYIWGYNAQDGEAEWILLTNMTPGEEWTFENATSGIPFNESWTVGTADDVILGNANYFDSDKGIFISMETAAVGLPPAVPEPSTAAILGAGIVWFGLRRRRPRQT